MIIAVIVPFGLTVIFRRQGILNKIDPAVPVEDTTGLQLQTADGNNVSPQKLKPMQQQFLLRQKSYSL